MSVIMTYLLRFLCLCNYKIGYGSAWSNWKQEFYLPLRKNRECEYVGFVEFVAWLS